MSDNILVRIHLDDNQSLNTSVIFNIWILITFFLFTRPFENSIKLTSIGKGWRSLQLVIEK